MNGREGQARNDGKWKRMDKGRIVENRLRFCAILGHPVTL